MDTYGHLFPGPEAETIARLPMSLGTGPEALKATGTDDAFSDRQKCTQGVSMGVSSQPATSCVRIATGCQSSDDEGTDATQRR